jgi:threonylcarbamoyladenosine tRNA methylthiotransferase MtaB
VNQYETQLVQEALFQSGYREAQPDETADLCVVNTCTVTSNGDSRSRQVVRQLARQNPGTRTIVMGCYATRDPKAVAALPSVAEVVTDKRELGDVLSRFGVVDLPAGISHFDGRRRAYVKVQDGCVLRCSYCIIPQVRPGLRSREPRDIVEEVQRLVANGYREIILTGIHLGHYGVDITRARSGRPRYRLRHLVQELDRLPGNWRMRLSSLEAAELDDELIDALADCSRLCPHLHPALQSGSDTVLKRMRRRYTSGRFLRQVERLQSRLVQPALSTDVIVGFPGETDAEFAETLQVCRAAGFMKIHVFPFSARKETPAAQLPGQVHGEIIQQRMNELLELERELAGAYYSRLLGWPLEVMVEGLAPGRPGFVQGTERRYCPVVLPGTAADIGRIVWGVGQESTRESLVAGRLSPGHEAATLSE